MQVLCEIDIPVDNIEVVEGNPKVPALIRRGDARVARNVGLDEGLQSLFQKRLESTDMHGKHEPVDLVPVEVFENGRGEDFVVAHEVCKIDIQGRLSFVAHLVQLLHIDGHGLGEHQKGRF